MLLKLWRTSSSRLEKLPYIPLGLGIYSFEGWHSSESPLRWDENIFHQATISKSCLCTFRSQSREYFLADPIHSFSCSLFQLPRALGLSLLPLGISVKFLFAFSFTLLVFFYIPLPAWCMKILQFWLQKDNIFKLRSICWVPGQGELLRVLGLSCSQPSPSP